MNIVKKMAKPYFEVLEKSCIFAKKIYIWGLLKTLFVMLNLFQHPFVKCFVCMGLRVKPSRVRKKYSHNVAISISS